MHDIQTVSGMYQAGRLTDARIRPTPDGEAFILVLRTINSSEVVLSTTKRRNSKPKSFKAVQTALNTAKTIGFSNAQVEFYN